MINASEQAPRQEVVAAPRIRVLDLYGSPRERGRSHGEALKTEIAEGIARWKKDLAQGLGMDADAFLAGFHEKTSLRSAVERWAPDLLEEVRGIAEGSRLPFETVLAFQYLDELWAMAQDVGVEKCTSVGVNRRGDRPAMVAQNLDIPEFMHLGPTVLRFQDKSSGRKALVLTVPGMIALNGLNDRGVGIAVNTLLQLAPALDGLPVAFVIRTALTNDSDEAAVKFVKTVRHAAGQNYLIGGRDKVVSLECSARKKVPYVPFEGAALTWHTNHPLRNDDWHPRYREDVGRSGGRHQAGVFSCPRFDVLVWQLRHCDDVTLDVVKSVLSSRKDAKAPISNDLTFGSTIMVLSEQPALHLAPGRPDQNSYELLSF